MISIAFTVGVVAGIGLGLALGLYIPWLGGAE